MQLANLKRRCHSRVGGNPCNAAVAAEGVAAATVIFRVGNGARYLATVAGVAITLAVSFAIAKPSSTAQGSVLARAQSEEAHGQWQQAAQDFRAVLSASPHSNAARRGLARTLAIMGQCNEAANSFSKISPQPGGEADLFLGVCHFRTRQFTQAITELRQAVRLTPESKQARIDLARSYAAAGQDEKAIGVLKEWLKGHSQDVDAMYWIGQFYEKLADQTFQQMEASHPNSYLVYETQGAQYRARQQYPQALAAFKKALALAPPGTPGLHFYIGDVYWRTLHLEDAERELKEELGLNPDHSKANFELGDLYAKEGNSQAAIPYLQKALFLDPHLVEAHRSLGRAYMQEKQYPQALNEFLQVEKAEPNNHTIHALLASAYRKLGRMNDAKREAQVSAQLENETIQKIQKNKQAEQNSVKNSAQN